MYWNLFDQSCPESRSASKTFQEDDDDADRKEKELKTEALLCAFETLGKVWPKNSQTQGNSTWFRSYSRSSLDTNIKIYLLKCLQCLIKWKFVTYCVKASS